MPTNLGDTLQRGQSGAGAFPVAIEGDLRVSSVLVADFASLANIPSWKLMSKMLAYSIADDKNYRLELDLVTWTEVVYSDPDALVYDDVFNTEGYIKSGLIQNLFINDSFVVASEVAMLALNTVTGNAVIRTDTGEVFIKINNNDPSVLADFADITGNTGAVTSVNGQTGAVNITIANLLAVPQNTTDFYAAVAASTSVSALLSSVSTLQGQYTSLSTTVSTLSTTVGTNSSDISTLQSAVSTLQGNLVIPDITGQATKYLTNDGSTLAWTNASGLLPSQAGQIGKFLTTDGTNAYWAAGGGGGFTLTDGNGTTANGTAVDLGGLLTGETVITSPGTGSRLSFGGFPVEYVADLSSDYTIRSLVDQGYVLGAKTYTGLQTLRTGTIAAGTAPLKFVSGPLNTTAEVGAVEFLTDKFYGTINTGTARKEFTLNDTTLSANRIPFTTTNGRLTTATGFTYSTSFIGYAANVNNVAGISLTNSNTTAGPLGATTLYLNNSVDTLVLGMTTVNNTDAFLLGSRGYITGLLGMTGFTFALPVSTDFKIGFNSVAALQLNSSRLAVPTLNLNAGTIALASLNVPHGVAPTTPVNGDIWTTTTSAYARINGATISLGGIANSAVNNEIMKSNGTNAVPSGLFSSTAGDVILGSGSIVGGRSISVASSDTDAALNISSKGTGAITFTTNGSTSFTIGSADYLTVLNAGSSKTLRFNNSGINWVNTVDSAQNTIYASRGEGTFSTTGRDLVLSGGEGYNVGNTPGGNLFLIPGAGFGSGATGNVGINTSGVADWKSMQGGLAITNLLVEPSAAIADSIAVYSVDSGGSTILGLRTETAVISDAAAISTNAIKVKINGTEYFIMLHT